MIGNIPEKLKMFVCNPISITLKYDDCDIQLGNTTSASPTYVSDAINKKTCATGEQWASNACRVYNKTTGIYDDGKYSTEVIDNSPITNVVITSLEHRGQGGRAYKVIVNNKYYVDLREDVLLDAILNVGIQAGGKLLGEYIFAKVGSQMKLIRVDSALHTALIKSTAMDKVTKVKNLQFGRIYESKKQKFVYLGEVKSTEIDLIEDKSAGSQNYQSYNSQNAPVNGKLSTTPVTGMLFYEIPSYLKNATTMELNPYRFSIKKSHSIRLDTGVDMEIPANWLETLKDKIYNDSLKEGSKHPTVSNSKFKEIYYMCYYSEIVNIDTIHPAFQRALGLV